jgi:hypothetical protein
LYGGNNRLPFRARIGIKTPNQIIRNCSQSISRISALELLGRVHRRAFAPRATRAQKRMSANGLVMLPFLPLESKKLTNGSLVSRAAR